MPMKITKESTEKSEEEHSELYHFPEDEELKVVLKEQEMDLNKDLSFLPEKLRKIHDKIFDSKEIPVKD